MTNAKFCGLAVGVLSGHVKDFSDEIEIGILKEIVIIGNDKMWTLFNWSKDVRKKRE